MVDKDAKPVERLTFVEWLCRFRLVRLLSKQRFPRFARVALHCELIVRRIMMPP
jgi:hypothetical protein